MTPLEIVTTVVTPYQQNARLLIDHQSKTVVCLDPGGDINKLLSKINLNEYTVSAIWLTHCHIDHAGGVQTLLSKLPQQKKPTILYHNLEIILAEAIPMVARQSGFSPTEYLSPPKPDIDFHSLSSLDFAGETFTVLFTPGHSPGHVAFFTHNKTSNIRLDSQLITTPLLLSGDTLFRGTIGRTDFPLSDHNTLLNSIKTQLFTLPDSTLVLPGHGGPTQIGIEKQTNPFFN